MASASGQTDGVKVMRSLFRVAENPRHPKKERFEVRDLEYCVPGAKSMPVYRKERELTRTMAVVAVVVRQAVRKARDRTECAWMERGNVRQKRRDASKIASRLG